MVEFSEYLAINRILAGTLQGIKHRWAGKNNFRMILLE
jgi:hypothetical protein